MTHHITSAYNFCRVKKIQYDGVKPCYQCEKRNIECIYEEYCKNV
ncbi:5676_t:CDS:1, partial [Dentiscutata heterogama]